MDCQKEQARQALLKKELEGTFDDLLRHYYDRSDHIAVPWKKAQRKVRHRSAYRDLVRSSFFSSEDAGIARAQELFNAHILLLRKTMGATEEDIRKAEEEAAKGEEDEVNEDDNEEGGEEKMRKSKKRSKSDKKSKKHKKSHKADKKRARRSRSSSSSRD